MRAGALATLVSREVRRSGGALTTASFGIMAGTAALTFFVALGLAVRAVLLGQVFPLDRVEFEPAAQPEPGLLSILVGGGKAPPGVGPEAVQRLRTAQGVVGVFPKLRFAFPSGAFGGAELIGREVGTHEMIADGIDPALVGAEVAGPFPFVDPLSKPGAVCRADDGCTGGQYCELPSGQAEGRCSEPVPVLVSPYLVELFNKGIARAHGLPAVGQTLLSKAQGITFRLQLGVSMMGKSRQGVARSARARVVGISPNAIDLGVTLPLEVVKRWNREFHGPEAAERFTSVVVRVDRADRVAPLIQQAAAEGLSARDSRARDVSVLISGVMGLLGLVAMVMLAVAASNIAYTFRVLVAERRAEIGLYRALGATPGEIGAWWLAVATVVGMVGGVAGVVVARVVALGADVGARRWLPDFPFKPESFFLFPPWLLALAALFGGAFALLGAVAGVRRAAGLDPARALLGP